MTRSADRSSWSEPRTLLNPPGGWPARAGSPMNKGDPLQIPKQQVLSLIERRMGPARAWAANSELPERVDLEQHADLLSTFGIDPQDLLGHRGGGAARTGQVRQ